MADGYQHVFTPINLGPVEVANRVYMSPHFSLPALGVTDDFAHYYAERAAGGVGMLIQSTLTGPLPVPGAQLPSSEESIPSFEKVAELMHHHGSKMFAELSYTWVAPGPWQFNGPTRPWLAPSAHQYFEGYSVAHEMSHEDIKAMIELNAAAVRNLRRAGYDGVEIHVTHGVMIEQFLSPYWNRRKDEYGGSFENRLRLLREVLEAVRTAAESEMAVGMRFICDEQLPGGIDQDLSREILAAICGLGLLDFVDLDIAVEPNQYPLGVPNYQFPKFVYEDYVRSVRAAAGSVPVLAVPARVTSIAEAERVLASGSCDMVGIARGLIAEPDLLRNAREGNEDQSRTCIACNYCLQENIRLQGFSCPINTATARERRWSPRVTQPAPEPKRLVVVGGGPAGVEAARTAAMRGHEVTLYEREGRLGGQFRLWSRLPGREGFIEAIDWYDRELPRRGVELRLAQEADASEILALEPDAVLVATGSRYSGAGESGFMPLPIPGADADFVYTPEQVLAEDGPVRLSGKVVVLDDEGLNAGVGIAELLADQGAEVELLTRWMFVAHQLVETMETPMIHKALKQKGVRLRPQTYVRAISPGKVTAYDVFTDADEQIENVDAVVLSTMRLPLTELVGKLEGKVDQLFTIGDASGPRDFGAAFYEGSLFARMVGEKDGPRTFTEAFFNTDSAFPQFAASIEIPTRALPSSEIRSGAA